tara:strand:- start:13320 stop:14339 length:1020 start_codon:yes stop_codon:yes gene_type:complete
MKFLIFTFLLLPLTASAAFNDYSNVNSFLNESDVTNKKVYVLLNDKRLFSTDYHPSSFKRARDEYPRYPTKMIKEGIEGFVEVGFIINKDGSTSDHRIINSEPSDYFDNNSLEEAKGLRYTRNANANYTNVEGSKHMHRFTFNLPEESRKVPNGVFSCMELIYQDKYLAAKKCSENRVSIHSGYTVPYAMALYYMDQSDQAIKLLTELLKDPQEESFYVKALSASAVSIFLFANKSYQEIIDLEPLLIDIRKVGYEEALLNAFYYLGVSMFYADQKINALFYLKLTQQDSNCKISAMNSNDDIKATKAQTLFRLIPQKNCYIDQYNRTEKTLKAINKII